MKLQRNTTTAMQGLIYEKQDMLQASQQFQHELQLGKSSAFTFKGKKILTVWTYT